jgi:hypothetical protein
VRVGYAAHLLLADEARRRGVRHYEYLAGDSRYKTELSTAERQIVWARLSRPSVHGLAVRGARAVRAVEQAVRAHRSRLPSANSRGTRA